MVPAADVRQAAAHGPRIGRRAACADDDNKVHALVDVRSPITQAATGRIPGARTIDMQKIAESFKGVPVDGEVIVYCACPNEATAVKVAQSLRKLGYKRIRPLHGGIDAWIAAGLAVEH